MQRGLLAPALAGVAALLAGILVFRLWFTPPEFASAPVRSAPAATTTDPVEFEQVRLADLDGSTQSLSQWQQPILLINFWAPWCAPCRREIPALIRLQQAYPQKLRVIGLSFDNRDNVLAFKPKFEFNYPLLLVGANAPALNRLFGNNAGGLPFTVLLNAERDIVASHSGELDDSQLNALIAPLLQEQ